MTTPPNSDDVHPDHRENNVGRPTTPDRSGLNEAHIPNQEPSSTRGRAPESARPTDRPSSGEQTDGDRHSRDEGTRNPNLDPQPENTPSLENGVGVKPGETPPESNSASASPPTPAPGAPPKTRTVTVVAAAVIVLLVLLIFVGYAIGLIG